MGAAANKDPPVEAQYIISIRMFRLLRSWLVHINPILIWSVIQHWFDWILDIRKHCDTIQVLRLADFHSKLRREGTKKVQFGIPIEHF